MRRKGFALRWIVLFCFAVFALSSIGLLLAARYGVIDDTVASTSTTTTAPTPAAPGVTVSPGTTPTVPSPAATVSPTPRPSLSPTPATTAQAPKVDILFPVNRQNALPSAYVPDDLVALTSVRVTTANQQVRRLVLPYLEKMLADARAAGHDLLVSSSYRSYAEQESVHAYWQRTLGKIEADRVSAQAGRSEHQMGTTVDFTSATVGYQLDERFGATPEGRWLRENAHRYGFVISYPAGKEAITGYAYEPWHLRYVGAEHAAIVFQRGITLEEYLRSLR